MKATLLIVVCLAAAVGVALGDFGSYGNWGQPVIYAPYEVTVPGILGANGGKLLALFIISAVLLSGSLSGGSLFGSGSSGQTIIISSSGNSSSLPPITPGK